jgi:Ca2+-binding RTX toxin-like protein
MPSSTINIENYKQTNMQTEVITNLYKSPKIFQHFNLDFNELGKHYLIDFNANHQVKNLTRIYGDDRYKVYFHTFLKLSDLQSFNQQHFSKIKASSTLLITLKDGKTIEMHNPVNVKFYFLDDLNNGFTLYSLEQLMNKSTPILKTYDYEIIHHLEGYDGLNGSFSGSAFTDYIYAEEGNDRIEGNDGDDYISGGRGNDTIRAGNGNDIIKGDQDNDTLYGGNGDDNIDGGAGKDNLYGENGNDHLNGGDDDQSNDTLNGGNGADTYYYTSKGGKDIINDNNNDLNTIILKDLNINDMTVIKSGNNIILQVDANNSLTINRLASSDTNYQFVFKDQTVTAQQLLSNISGTDNNDSFQTLTDNSIVHAKAGNDNITVKNNTKATIYGDNGNDRLTGANLNDNLFGNDGNDTLTGNNGDDNLFGNNGNDTISGNNGNDVILGGNNNDRLSGNDGDDKLFGNQGNDTLNGDNGNDLLDGGTGKDTLNGGNGDDTYIYKLGYGEDSITDRYGMNTIKLIGINLSDVSSKKQGNTLKLSINKNTNNDTNHSNTDNNDLNNNDVNNSNIINNNSTNIVDNSNTNNNSSGAELNNNHKSTLTLSDLFGSNMTDELLGLSTHNNNTVGTNNTETKGDLSSIYYILQQHINSLHSNTNHSTNTANHINNADTNSVDDPSNIGHPNNNPNIDIYDLYNYFGDDKITQADLNQTNSLTINDINSSYNHFIFEFDDQTVILNKNMEWVSLF